MVVVPRDVVDGMTFAVNKASSELQERLAVELASLDYTDTSWTEDVSAIMQGFCSAGCDIAGTLSGEWYGGIRRLALGSEGAAGACVDRVPEATETAVRAIMRTGQDGDIDAMVRSLQARVDYEMKRQAAHTVLLNGEMDAAEVRYARVPTGSETCRFCIMLASRGPVYLSEFSASHSSRTGADHYHANCDCRIVPFFGTSEDGASRRAGTTMVVEGYDPDALYDRYLDFMEDPRFAESVRKAAGDWDADREVAIGRRRISFPQGVGTNGRWGYLFESGFLKYGSVADILDAIDACESLDELYAVVDTVGEESRYYYLDSYDIGKPPMSRLSKAAKERRSALMAASD